MHILLTDILACPRCGPEFGLILLADRVEDRRVVHGYLGCPNCREEYPIRAGVADLRFPATSDSKAEQEQGGSSPELALRIAALLGVRTPGARILLAGAGAELAQEFSQLLPGVEVIALTPKPGPAEPEQPAVSVVAAGSALPFQLGKLHAAAILGAEEQARLEQVARLLAPGARLLMEPVSNSLAARLTAAELELVLQEAGSVLAVRRGVAHPQTRS